jgi:hypothetical protein
MIIDDTRSGGDAADETSWPGHPSAGLEAEDVVTLLVPDTSLARAATEVIRDAEDDVLFHHSRRAFFFAALASRRRSLHPDLELLYVAAMFHDLGLSESFRDTSPLRFEIDGAYAARDFLLEHGAGEASAQKVWLAIALHTTPGIPEHLEPEIAMLNAGVRTDVVGVGLEDLSSDVVEAIIAVHPRPHFKQEILHAFAEGTRRRPWTTYWTILEDVLEQFDESFVRQDFVTNVLSSDWPS